MLKNYKKCIIIFSLILILFVTIGSISASENCSEEVMLQDSQSQENVINSEDITEDISADNSDLNALEESSEEILSSNSNESEILSSPGSSDGGNNDIKYGVYESTHAECSASTQKYSSGNIVYKFSLYDIVSYDGAKYKQPKYGDTVDLRVYTGSAYKTYHDKVGNDGKASIKIPNLSIGTHKVEVYYANVKLATSSIKVIKSTTKVYAPVKTIKHKKNTYYKIKVLDSHGNPVKKVTLKVKVFTGKSSKTYSIKTSSKGIAKLKTKGLALGTHKITIKTKNKKYKISKKTKIVIKKKVPKKAEKLSVSAPASTVMYTDNHYYEIAVKNSYADPVKKLVLKVKLYTGKKYKTYSIKTDSKGVAKLQTKYLGLGTHKISISTKNKNYKVSKSSKVTVKNGMVYDNGLTRLKTLLFYPQGDDYQAKLTWYAKPGITYQVLKKTNGDYGVLSTVQADGDTASYLEKVNKSDIATYSVREIQNGNVIGPHDVAGLTLINCPNVDVDFQNLKAIITWSKISDATKYRVFRKMGHDGDYNCIAIVDGKLTSYTDWYYKSSDELSEILNSKTFADPSYNNLFYTVRACNIKDVDDVQKVSYGLYLKDGDFNLESPSIIYLKDNKISWGKVPNAEGYIILKRANKTGDWEEIAQCAASDNMQISLEIGEIDNSSYYTVKAFATKNGEMVYSKYDEGFTLRYYSQNNSDYRVLFFGDSITFGSPYYAASTIHVFSMPYRIAQLTGCVYYNPSIPGSTYHDLGVNPDGTNIENTNYYRYRITREVVDPISVGELPGNWETLDSAKNSEGRTNTNISEYNVVVLLAGTNDYLDNTVIGSIDDTSTYTFHGALNHILGKVKEASDVRVANNEDPIKLVFVDLFYSDRTYKYTQLNNRDVTPNQIGLTLMDYQKALDEQLQKWSLSFETFNFKTRDYDIVNQANCPYTASDNLHFSKFTYGQYGNALAEFFVDNVFK